MATHSNIFAWKTPWTEEPGRLQSMGLQRAGHDWAPEHTHAHTHKQICDYLIIFFSCKQTLINTVAQCLC